MEEQQPQLSKELKQTEQAKRIPKAKQLIHFGSAVLGASLVMAVVTAVFTGKATQTFQEALLSAVQAGQELKPLVKNKRSPADYPTGPRQSALQRISCIAA